MSEIERERDKARHELILAALRVVKSEWYAREHADDPHGDAEAEYADEMLDYAARDLVAQLGPDERNARGVL